MTAADWEQRWRDALGGHGRRVVSGRILARSGRVTDVRVDPGRVSGRVQGSRATPFLVDVGLPVLSETAWDTVVEVLAGQVRHGARLLAGQAPEGLEEELRAAGVALFPTPSLVEPACGCGEPVSPCMHAAAVWEAAAERIGRDPFELFRLRGRGRQRILAAVAAARRRTPAATEPVGVALDRIPAEGFARMRAPLDDLDQPELDPPRVPAGPLVLLGDPPGWAGGVSAADLFGPLVVDGAALARRLLDPQPSEPDAG